MVHMVLNTIVQPRHKVPFNGKEGHGVNMLRLVLGLHNLTHLPADGKWQGGVSHLNVMYQKNIPESFIYNSDQLGMFYENLPDRAYIYQAREKIFLKPI